MSLTSPMEAVRSEVFRAADSEDLMLQLDCKVIYLETNKQASVVNEVQRQSSGDFRFAQRPAFHSIPTHIMKTDPFT